MLTSDSKKHIDRMSKGQSDYQAITDKEIDKLWKKLKNLQSVQTSEINKICKCFTVLITKVEIREMSSDYLA